MLQMHAKYLFGVALVAGLVTCFVGRASAQSQRSEALPLTSNQLSGHESLRGQSYYYYFDAGPGAVQVALNGSTDFDSTNLHFIFTEESGKQIADFSMFANSTKASKNFSLRVPQRERIILQVMFPLDSGPHVDYSLGLSGQVANTVPTIAEQYLSSTVNQRPASDAQTSSSTEAAKSAGTAGTIAVTGTPVAPPPAVPLEILENTPVDDKWALIVGTSRFADPVLNLKYSAKDASDLYNFLINKGNFARDHVKLLVNEQATKERVLAEIGDKWLPKVAHPNDLVLIFISSHGSPSQMDLEGLNYLVLYNTDPNSLYATGLPLQELVAAIKHRVHSNRVVVIIDACHSGAANPAKGLTRAGNFNSDAIVQGTGQLVICSSEPSQVSWESKRYENGVFTRQLIDALGSPAASNGLNKLFAKLKENVESEVLHDRGELQSPVLKSLWNGNSLILTAPPAIPRPAPDSAKN